MNKTFKIMLLGIVILSSIYSTPAVIGMMSLEASLFDSNGDPVNGSITIEIYDAVAGGNLVYNSSDDSINRGIDITEVEHGAITKTVIKGVQI